ncbi:hypothetical protein PPERSA_10463 [Pseudocohnilembus persalinus]|uniref:RRM domain-containing protein n=1 Tax=Pseudocohnilembus persalinus TaxID=266149 RepID=A0A0V0Q7R6_PSEPJ|nr:hypothetical protein PPERSA_10463 [Pseudocohnilembus persalinus]|eukprot:KRW98291.1 hypothetical protein PPERSA_10463 [Pseudocohnilembus persalinus]
MNQEDNISLGDMIPKNKPNPIHQKKINKNYVNNNNNNYNNNNRINLQKKPYNIKFNNNNQHQHQQQNYQRRNYQNNRSINTNNKIREYEPEPKEEYQNSTRKLSIKKNSSYVVLVKYFKMEVPISQIHQLAQNKGDVKKISCTTTQVKGEILLEATIEFFDFQSAQEFKEEYTGAELDHQVLEIEYLN